MKFSVRQILASAGGAVLAALIASAFGVKGTIVGVAIGSAAATIGTALVAQSIDRGHEAMKQVAERVPDSSTLLRRLGTTEASGAPSSSDPEAAPAWPASSGHSASTAGEPGQAAAETARIESSAAAAATTGRFEASAVADAPATERLEAVTTPVPPVGADTFDGTSTRLRTGVQKGAGSVRPLGRFSWKTIAATAAIVFVLALLFVTAIELIAGKPLSSIFGHGGTGTSLNNVINPSSPPASTTTTTSTTTPTSTTSVPSTTPAYSSTSSTSSTTSTTTTSTTVPSTTTTTNLGGTTTTTGAAATSP